MKSPKKMITIGLTLVVLMTTIIIPSANALQAIRVERKSATIAKTFDLEVLDLETTPENPQIGERIDIAARILNKGTQTIPAFTVEAYDQTGWKTFGAGALIQPGQTRVVHMELITSNLNKQQILYTNPHRFKVVVDPRNLIKELDEENNSQIIEIVVSDPDQKEDLLPTEFKVHDSVDYNNRKSVILSWYEADSDVNYNIRYYTRYLEEPGETYGMKFYSMSNAQGFKYSVPEENLSEEYKNTVKAWPEANFNFHVYTAATGYHAAEFFVSDEKINEFAITAEKNGHEQIGPEVRFYYKSPESLQVHNLSPSEDSSFSSKIELGWTETTKT